MNVPTKSKIKSIKDVDFTDGHIWIHGTVKKVDGKHVEIDDGTGTLAFDMVLELNSTESEPTVVKGKLAAGAFVRVIGDVEAHTNKSFTFTPVIVQNLDELGVDKGLFTRVRAIEKKFGGDKQ